MIETGQMQRAMDDQPPQFIEKRVFPFRRLLQRLRSRDIDFTPNSSRIVVFPIME